MVGIDANLLDRRTLLRSRLPWLPGIESATATAPVEKPVARWRSASRATRSRAQGRLCLVAEDNATNRQVILRQLALLGVLPTWPRTGRWRSSSGAAATMPWC